MELTLSQDFLPLPHEATSPTTLAVRGHGNTVCVFLPWEPGGSFEQEQSRRSCPFYHFTRRRHLDLACSRCSRRNPDADMCLLQGSEHPLPATNIPRVPPPQHPPAVLLPGLQSALQQHSANRVQRDRGSYLSAFLGGNVLTHTLLL